MLALGTPLVPASHTYHPHLYTSHTLPPPTLPETCTWLHMVTNFDGSKPSPWEAISCSNRGLPAECGQDVKTGCGRGARIVWGEGVSECGARV